MFSTMTARTEPHNIKTVFRIMPMWMVGYWLAGSIAFGALLRPFYDSSPNQSMDKVVGSPLILVLLVVDSVVSKNSVAVAEIAATLHTPDFLLILVPPLFLGAPKGVSIITSPCTHIRLSSLFVRFMAMIAESRAKPVAATLSFKRNAAFSAFSYDRFGQGILQSRVLRLWPSCDDTRLGLFAARSIAPHRANECSYYGSILPALVGANFPKTNENKEGGLWRRRQIYSP